MPRGRKKKLVEGTVEVVKAEEALSEIMGTEVKAVSKPDKKVKQKSVEELASALVSMFIAMDNNGKTPIRIAAKEGEILVDFNHSKSSGAAHLNLKFDGSRW